MAGDDLGSTPASAAFGADIRFDPSGHGLYFVVGHTGALGAPLSEVGASVRVQLDTRRVLATMSFEAFTALRRDRRIALVGPVAIDAERFAAFARLVGVGATDATRP